MDTDSTAGAAGSASTDPVGSVLHSLSPIVERVEGVLCSVSFPPPPNTLDIVGVSTKDLVDPAPLTVAHTQADNRCNS